jgi:23S rRNA pseudouridine2605 synthase
LPRVISVGRLDLTSEGLLLLTNDGGLARRLELPATGWLRRYRVRVYGVPDPAALAALARGVTVEGVHYGPIDAAIDARKAENAWLTVSLKEGRNREVRRVMAHLGLAVTRLIRVAYGPFQLGDLPRGGVEEVPARILRTQLPSDVAPRPPSRSARG